eukprot:2870110-Prymnesium_polylepis.1
MDPHSRGLTTCQPTSNTLTGMRVSRASSRLGRWQGTLLQSWLVEGVEIAVGFSDASGRALDCEQSGILAKEAA